MMDLRRLNELVFTVLDERGLERRFCHTAVVAAPPDGHLRVECTDLDALAEIEARAGDDAAGVTFHALDGRDLPDGLIVSSSVADVRREAAHTAELVTQAIYGDPVAPLGCDGDWYLVRLADGYLGWIRSWHLSAMSPSDQARFAAQARHRVASNHAVVVDAPAEDALPVSDLVVGTHLKITNCDRRGWRAAVLPDGKAGFVTARSVEPVPARRFPPPREALAATGKRFLGIPYLWGGNTPKGFDCSGLVQRVFGLHGVDLPRDSDLQARVGTERPAEHPGDLQTGDLMFFGRPNAPITHVAMVLPDGLFLHAFGQVRVGSMDPQHRLYEPDLHRIWRLSRDPLGA